MTATNLLAGSLFYFNNSQNLCRSLLCGIKGKAGRTFIKVQFQSSSWYISRRLHHNIGAIPRPHTYMRYPVHFRYGNAIESNLVKWHAQVVLRIAKPYIQHFKKSRIKETPALYLTGIHLKFRQ